MAAIKAKRGLGSYFDSIFERGGKRASRRLRRTRTHPKSGEDVPEQQALGPDRTYVVQVGDSLSKIAEDTLGDSARWPEILEANKEQMMGAGLLRVGSTLHIPEE